MRFFVTGLCLQGNKGGPAIALSLMEQLNEVLNTETIEFIFSVPSGEEYQYELTWANYYEVEVIEDFSIKKLLSFWKTNRFLEEVSKAWQWIKVLRHCDLFLEMSAISYVGPPTGSLKNILNYRFRYFICAKLFQKTFLAWTQSYGPFSNYLIKLLAKIDLSSQPIIFCRGKGCQRDVLELLPQKKSLSFPDVAITLSYDPLFGNEYITKIFDSHGIAKNLITISPSAVIYSKTTYKKELNLHVIEVAALCQYLSETGYQVLLVPHTYRKGRPVPEICDYAVCLQIQNNLKSKNIEIPIIEEDLSPQQLKSIISCAYIHIGARYHSVVAALSAQVPAISLAWHSKYLDLMSFYGFGSFVYDGLGQDGSSEKLFQLFDNLVVQHQVLQEKMIENHNKMTLEVNKNSSVFSDLILEGIR